MEGGVLAAVRAARGGDGGGRRRRRLQCAFKAAGLMVPDSSMALWGKGGSSRGP